MTFPSGFAKAPYCGNVQIVGLPFHQVAVVICISTTSRCLLIPDHRVSSGQTSKIAHMINSAQSKNGKKFRGAGHQLSIVTWKVTFFLLIETR